MDLLQDCGPRYRSQYWYADPFSHNTVGSIYTDGDLHVRPFYVYRQTCFDAVGIQCTAGGVDGACDIGLYFIGKQQGTIGLMYSATGLSLAAATTVTSTIRWYLPRGAYMVAARYADPSASGPAVATIRRVTGLPYLGQSVLASLNIAGNYTGTGYAALPAAVALSALSAGSGSNIISVMLRVA